MALRKQPAVPRTVLTFVEKYCDKDKWILWFKILVACLPTIIIALPFNDIIEKKFYNYVVVAIMLIVYGVLFIVIENYNKRRRPTCTRLDELSFKTALIIGCFQVLSVIPGTSVPDLPLSEESLQEHPVQLQRNLPFSWQFRLCSEQVF